MINRAEEPTPNQCMNPHNVRPNGLNTAPPPNPPDPAVAAPQYIRLKQAAPSDMTAPPSPPPPPPCLSLTLDNGRMDASIRRPDYAARLAEPQQKPSEPNRDGDHDCSDTDLRLSYEPRTPRSWKCIMDHHQHRGNGTMMIPTQLRLFGVEVKIMKADPAETKHDSTTAFSDADDTRAGSYSYDGSRKTRRRRRDCAVVVVEETTTASDLSSDHEFLCISSAATKRQRVKEMVMTNDHSNPNPKSVSSQP